jgi:hypothetical protein
MKDFYELLLMVIVMFILIIVGVTALSERELAYKISEPNSTNCETIKTSEEAVVWSCGRSKKEEHSK